MSGQTILLATAGESDAAVRSALEQAGFVVQPVTLDVASDRWPAAELAVVDSAGGADAASAFGRRWREQHREQELPLVWLADVLDPHARAAGWQAGADAVIVRPLALGELATQVTKLLQGHDERERLAVRAGESMQINQTLIQLYAQIDADFRIARRIQRSCRPTNLPAIGQARFAVSHRERMGSSGDFYNVLRVDEERVAFLLGDVMGQSLTACMLAVYLHQSVAPKDIDGQSYRVVPPDEVLHRLNRQLAALGMPEPPMVRLTYGLLNCRTGELSYACAGHTPPLYLPATDLPELWHDIGPLLGPGDTKFPVRQTQLRSGDRLLLFTDGLYGGTPGQAEDLLKAVEPLRTRPLQALVESLTHDMLARTAEPDDFTMVGLEFA